MVSAVLNPMPQTSDASRNGSSRTTAMDSPTYFL